MERIKHSPITFRFEVTANIHAIKHNISNKRIIGGGTPNKVIGERTMMVHISHPTCLSIPHLSKRCLTTARNKSLLSFLTPLLPFKELSISFSERLF